MKKLGKKIIIPASARLDIAPHVTRRYGLHYSILIGIGKDHIAELIINDEALKALNAGEPINV